jgi:hypothetical protein
VLSPGHGSRQGPQLISSGRIPAVLDFFFPAAFDPGSG